MCVSTAGTAATESTLRGASAARQDICGRRATVQGATPSQTDRTPEGAAVFDDLDAAGDAVESADFVLPWEAHFEVRTDDGEWAENFPESDHPAGHP